MDYWSKKSARMNKGRLSLNMWLLPITETAGNPLTTHHLSPEGPLYQSHHLSPECLLHRLHTFVILCRNWNFMRHDTSQSE